LISTCDVDLDESRYMTVVRTKTAVLIAAACQCGGILGKIGEEEQSALHEFGMELGIAFQFMDDALDYVAEESEFGKVRGHDLAEGKMTLPLIEALRRCSAEERSRVAEIIEQDALADGDVADVVALIELHNGIEYTRSRAQTLIDRAKGHLISFPDGAAKEALYAVADYVVRRRKSAVRPEDDSLLTEQPGKISVRRSLDRRIFFGTSRYSWFFYAGRAESPFLARKLLELNIVCPLSRA